MQFLAAIFKLLIPFVVEILRQREKSQVEVVEIAEHPLADQFWQSEKK